jgi:hypothetical protein
VDWKPVAYGKMFIGAPKAGSRDKFKGGTGVEVENGSGGIRRSEVECAPVPVSTACPLRKFGVEEEGFIEEGT